MRKSTVAAQGVTSCTKNIPTNANLPSKIFVHTPAHILAHTLPSLQVTLNLGAILFDRSIALCGRAEVERSTILFRMPTKFGAIRIFLNFVGGPFPFEDVLRVVHLQGKRFFMVLASIVVGVCPCRTGGNRDELADDNAFHLFAFPFLTQTILSPSKMQTSSQLPFAADF